MMLRTLAGAALFAATMMAPLPANAAFFAGEFWDVDPSTIATIDEAIAAVGGGSVATTATFLSTSINYGDASADWAIGSLSNFLAVDAGSIVGTDVSDIQESVFRLTGEVFLQDGQDISVTSDDGFRLIIGGSTFSEYTGLRGPYSTTNAIWLGGAGLFDMTLWYFEGHQTQARLNLTISAVPLPATIFMFIAALAALAGLGQGMGRRNKIVA